MKKYCQGCNQATEYEDIPAKFCQHCGLPFAGTIASQIKAPISQPAAPPPQRQQKQERVESDLASRIKSRARDDREEYEDRRSVLDSNSNLSFDVPEFELEGGIHFERPTVKMETLAFDKGKKEKIIRPKNKQKLEKVIEEIRNEVGGGRKNSKTIGGDGGE